MRRAVALLHTDHDASELDALVQRNGLRLVFTVRTDTRAVLAALIAVQHALEHAAEVVVIPHLRSLGPDTPWWAVTDVAELITGTRLYPLRASIFDALGDES
ncbi:hypothetical protein NLM24_01955 [Nocardia zapadnayensis]|uniref:hypothetical protein n=1 Tax=Nocardia rhamnosiphila TaxID=426716 RepID=UPI002247DB6C|nr:hypothetical protein [Nocardia zapadnayensis]MCX0269495.1 hypothetical protein [Nocardia zapadnayensis]